MGEQLIEFLFVRMVVENFLCFRARLQHFNLVLLRAVAAELVKFLIFRKLVLGSPTCLAHLDAQLIISTLVPRLLASLKCHSL